MRSVAREGCEGRGAGLDKSTLCLPGKVMLKIPGLYSKKNTPCSNILQVRTMAYPGRNEKSNYEMGQNSSFISLETFSVFLSLFLVRPHPKSS